MSPEFSLEKVEKYTSFRASPNEQIVTWLKWDPNAEFDSILLVVEENIKILRVINVDGDVIRGYQSIAGRAFSIPKKQLEVNGFLSLVSKYSRIPPSEIEAKFRFDFIKNNERIFDTELITRIIVPGLQPLNVSESNITISESSTDLSISLNVERTGEASAKNVEAFWNFHTSNRAIKIFLDGKEISGSQKINTEDDIRKNIRIKGSGIIILRMTLRYEDLVGNKYGSGTVEFVINKLLDEPTMIPFIGTFPSMLIAQYAKEQ